MRDARILIDLMRRCGWTREIKALCCKWACLAEFGRDCSGLPVKASEEALE